MRRLLIILYIVVVVAMATATIVEKYYGTIFTHHYFYGSWWFTALWAALAVVGIVWFVRRKIRRLSTIAVHLALILILLGALLTHLTSRQGRIHLRTGEPVQYQGYTLRLESFNVDYHSGTTTAADYHTVFTLTDGDKEVRGEVSMNKIFSYGTLRLYQSSYDDDLCGSILMANTDPWGIGVTYTGYGLLLLSLIWALLSPRGLWRRALRTLSMGSVSLLMLCCLTSCNTQSLSTFNFQLSTSTPPTLPRDVADHFGELLILHNGRICPFETYALEMTRKVAGSSTYKGLTAEQVALGWMFFPDEWSKEPFIEVKSSDVRSRLQIPRHRSLNDFFVREMGGYTIGPYVQEYYNGRNDSFHKGIAEVDEKIQILMSLSRGSSLKVFPHTFNSDYSRTHTNAAIHKGDVSWYAPTDALHHSIDQDEQAFIHGVFALIYEAVHNGDYTTVTQLTDKLIAYQQSRGGSSLPTATQLTAEHINNSAPLTTILFIFNLTIGFLSLLSSFFSHIVGAPLVCARTVEDRNLVGAGRVPARAAARCNIIARQITRKFFIDFVDLAPAQKSKQARLYSLTSNVLHSLFFISFIALTFLLIIRYIISDSLPLSNGYETMLLLAWLIMLISLILPFSLSTSFGCLLSGFALLVSHLGIMNPAIGHLMPVLNSPLLSIHVSIIMVAYALLSLTFLISLIAIVGPHFQLSTFNFQLLSQILLVPAVVTLAIGIFVGAVWANVSWGVYWSWDPKEVWALITLMIYAVPLHCASLPVFSRPRVYHIYMICAFATVVMTYFGVNYLLGGMHSYA